ncbi:MAG TPA: alkaline phosphatase [Candidatus Acidoferrales bacterium]|nr:alkaline phosphatase [Candidatus Acidoferrales bacterium]
MNPRQKRARLRSAAALILLFVLVLPKTGHSSAHFAPKYIFIFLADGAGLAHIEIARLFNSFVHGQGLILSDKIMKEGRLGLLTTHAADALVTDSGAAATALATGCKTNLATIGMCADGSRPKTVLEAAKEKGMRIGLITTAEVYDASPAAFAAHAGSRGAVESICEQYLNLEPDILMGGGRDLFVARSRAESRRNDDKDLIRSFEAKGYTYIDNKSALERAAGPKILGLFSVNDMSFEIDKDKGAEPSLSDMLAAALRLLAQDLQNGFVLFIENEHVDSAAHLSDLPSLIHELRDFDRAIGLAYDFYKKYPNETLLLVTSDHEAGGLNLTSTARPGASGRVTRVGPTSEDIKKLAAVRISVRRALALLGPNPTAEAVRELVEQYYAGFTLAPEVVQAIVEKRFPGPTFSISPTAAALGAMIASNTHAYWSTSSHTGQPVFVAALGPGADTFGGYQDNTDFAKNLFRLLGHHPTQPDRR